MAQAEGTGLFQFLQFTLPSPATAAYTGVQTGGDLTVNPQPRVRTGIGGQTIRRGGLIVPGGSAEFYLTPTNLPLLTAAQRASYPKGALTELSLSGGMDAWSWDYATAVIDSAGIDYKRGEGLKANVKWGSLTVEEGAGGTQAAETDLDFEDYEFVISVGTVEYGVSDVSIKWKNNVKFENSADTKVAGAIRMPTYYLYGIEELTVDITADRPFSATALTLVDDDLSGALGCVLTGTNGVNVCTITLTNLMPGENTHGYVDANTGASYKQSFIGDSTAGSLTVAIEAEEGEGA